jgi:Xaa-Pro dipeptidase
MGPGFLNRAHAKRLMSEQGIDVLVLAQPETLTYATGAFPGVATFWRRAGAAFLVVPAEPGSSVTAIVGDLQAQAFQAQSGIADVRAHRLWVETAEYDGSGEIAEALVRRDIASGKRARWPRPGQYDIRESIGLLRDCLAERGLLKARIGIELGFVAVREFAVFQDLLPDVIWVDPSPMVERLRSIKHPGEIEKLRLAAELSAAGLHALSGQIAKGMNAARMTELWRDGVTAEARRRGVPPPDSTWTYIAVGGDGFAPGRAAEPGDIIKIDVGCVIDGYSSDGARTAVLGKPSPAARGVYDALHRAFDAGLEILKPGVALKDVHSAVSQSMWEQGFTTYGRGHFGHGVGASIWSEEWPFISSDATAMAEPGMVLAFETPYYIKGLGGFIIEDQILLMEDAIEVMAPLPRHLIAV